MSRTVSAMKPGTRPIAIRQEGAAPAPAGGTRRSRRRVFVRDLRLDAAIGVYGHEHGATQPVRINVDLWVDETGPAIDDRLENVVCYAAVVEGIKAIVAAGHVNLVETLAERIAELCLDDRRVARARVRVEKLAAVAEAESVGVEIERQREN